jgi:Lon protease-like protein
MGDVEFVCEGERVEVPEQFSILEMIAARFMEQLSGQYRDFEPAQLQDAHWLGYRLSELLPLQNSEKQVLLELDNPLKRLQILLEVLPRFQESALV